MTVALTPVGNPLATVTQVDTADCAQSNGALTLNVQGGLGPYQYDWDSGDTTATATNLSGGVYLLFVTDVNGCTSTVSSTVLDLSDSPENPQFAPMSPVCVGDAATLSVQHYAGSTVSYQWRFNGNPFTNNSNVLLINL